MRLLPGRTLGRTPGPFWNQTEPLPSLQPSLHPLDGTRPGRL